MGRPIAAPGQERWDGARLRTVDIGVPVALALHGIGRQGNVMSSGDIQRGPDEWESLCVEGAERRQHRCPSLIIAPYRREGPSPLRALPDLLSAATEQVRSWPHLHQ